MKKIPAAIKKYWFIPLVSIAAIVYLASILIKSPPPTISPTPVTKTATFDSLTPGISTQDQVNTDLGKPVNTKTTDGQTVFDYKSTSQNRFHQVTFTNGVATLIKEVVTSTDNIKSDFVTNNYGVAPYMFYNNNANNAFNLYIYPSNGIAYLGHTDGTILEIWYFQPTTIDDFTKNWGTGFSKTQPIGGGAY
jgi:outer membrane protein assembly factor BamE (lipoprotein component of BamABCDE complex)